MASDPDGEQSDQSDNPVNSEVVMNCVAIFYEEGKGGENYRKKKVPLFGKSRGEEAGEIQGNRLVSTILLYLLLTYLNSTSIIDIFLSYTVLEKMDWQNIGPYLIWVSRKTFDEQRRLRWSYVYVYRMLNIDAP